MLRPRHPSDTVAARIGGPPARSTARTQQFNELYIRQSHVRDISCGRRLFQARIRCKSVRLKSGSHYRWLGGFVSRDAAQHNAPEIQNVTTYRSGLAQNQWQASHSRDVSRPPLGECIELVVEPLFSLRVVYQHSTLALSGAVNAARERADQAPA